MLAAGTMKLVGKVANCFIGFSLWLLTLIANYSSQQHFYCPHLMWLWLSNLPLYLQIIGFPFCSLGSLSEFVLWEIHLRNVVSTSKANAPRAFLKLSLTHTFLYGPLLKPDQEILYIFLYLVPLYWKLREG